MRNLIQEHGDAPIQEFQAAYPGLKSSFYDPKTVDLEEILAGADLVIVHEWNERDLVGRIGRCRRQSNHFRLLFHDTHHRSVTDPESMALYDLSNYDGVLAYGEAIRQIYVTKGWARHVWTWHEAADTRIFYPRERTKLEGDLVWIGNWGDEERTAELKEFLLDPVRDSGIKARAYGVRYPEAAQKELAGADIEYGDWLPNYRAPETFANFCVTVHIPRRPYAERLPGIPTIRPFEAMACGIPLISSPWEDREQLFHPDDFLIARNSAEMKEHLRVVLNDFALARSVADRGRETILKRHTCAHRVDQLLGIYEQLCTPASALSTH